MVTTAATNDSTALDPTQRTVGKAKNMFATKPSLGPHEFPMRRSGGRHNVTPMFFPSLLVHHDLARFVAVKQVVVEVFVLPQFNLQIETKSIVENLRPVPAEGALVLGGSWRQGREVGGRGVGCRRGSPIGLFANPSLRTGFG